MNLDSYALFRDHKDTLHELSRDDHDSNNIQYMTDSESLAVAFDEVKTVYCNERGMSEEKASSVDAVVQLQNSDIIFIEFKNGKNFSSNEVKEKGNESIMLLCDITGIEIGNTRKNTDFILVYNEKNKPLQPNEQKAKRMAELSHLPYVRFNLNAHEGFCFRTIRTLDCIEFKKWVLENLG